MRSTVPSAILTVVTLLLLGCGGGTGYSTPSAPSASSPPPASPAPQPTASTTVSIIGSVGSQAFAPNPVSVATGGTVAWRNADSVVHHIVLDSGTDLGNLAPGATSRAVTVSTGGAVAFHCTIHPSMVGSINGATPEAPTDPNPGY